MKLVIVSMFYFGAAYSQVMLDQSVTEIDLNVLPFAHEHLRFEEDDRNFLYYQGFVIRYSCHFRTPFYTIHRLTVDQLCSNDRVSAKRRSNFTVERSLPRSCVSTNLAYRGSGYDRGHMVPAGDFYWDKFLKDQTFVLSNICPQNPVLNRGKWAHLEESIRQKVLKTNKECYVITGVLFDSTETFRIGIDSVAVPLAFYKIIFFPELMEAYAFLFDNGSTLYWGPLEDFQVSIDAVEYLSGEDFFEKLDDVLENDIESTVTSFHVAETPSSE